MFSVGFFRKGKIREFGAFKEQEFNDYLYFQYLVQKEKSLFDSFINPANINQNLIVAMEELDAFYLLNKLHLLGKFINLEKQFNLSAEHPKSYEQMVRNKDFMILVCQLISKNELGVKPFIQLFAALIIFRMGKEPDQADIPAEKFVLLLEEHQHSIPLSLLEEFEIQLRNHWTNRYHQTRKEDYIRLIHIRQLQQVERLRNNKSPIPASQLNNIVFTALRLGLSEWAEEVLNLLGPRIIDADAEIIYPILLTHLLFKQKRYVEASKVLPHFFIYGELNDMAFYGRAAKLDIKIRYELNCLLDDAHFSMFRATQIKLRRDTSLTSEKREQRQRFYPLVMKLYRIKEYLKYNPKANVEKRLQDVQDALNDKSQPVVDADWLQAKIDEFKTGSK